MPTREGMNLFLALGVIIGCVVVYLVISKARGVDSQMVEKSLA
jgi:hypothetical protein